MATAVADYVRNLRFLDCPAHPEVGLGTHRLRSVGLNSLDEFFHISADFWYRVEIGTGEANRGALSAGDFSEKLFGARGAERL